MPLNPSAKSLRDIALEAIAADYELICYGSSCKEYRRQILETDSYKLVEGPFVRLPSTLLEDIIVTAYRIRSLPKQMLHQLIQPQLESFKIYQRTSRHIQCMLVRERCSRLKSLEFTYSKSIQPMFYVKFFTSFPQLVKISLDGTIVDDTAFDSIGDTCHNLRYISVSSSTITDKGLQFLSVGDRGIASLLYFHPNLVCLETENMSPVFEELTYLVAGAFTPQLGLRHLAFSGSDVGEGLFQAITCCPFATSLVLRQTDLTSRLLDTIMTIQNLNTLHLGNSSFTQYTLDWEETVVPILVSVGINLVNLNLERFHKIDVSTIGELCPRLETLRISTIRNFKPVFNPCKDLFSKLKELTLLNTRGAHIYTNNIRQLLAGAADIVSLTLQFVDTVNDDTWSELLCDNQMDRLEVVVFDQCHSISLYTIEGLLLRTNRLCEIGCWSCRFIMDSDKRKVDEVIKENNFDVRFDWYPYTGEQAPWAMEDLEDVDTDEDDEEEEEDGGAEEPEWANYWNDAPRIPGFSAGLTL